ncbi:N-acetyltransferase family protein [Croceiramulus getboli]|nr:GNAT family N-acetyltransferase [Flavobacteriaceae bacterium YJPT1-3]
MKIHVRYARQEDMSRVLELIHALAHYEKEPGAVAITTDDLIRDGFGKVPLFQCFVAEYDGQIEGMALIYFRYSTWKGKTVHLEDLIVSEDMRGKGLGTALYELVMRFAHQEGVKRVEWVVLDWNTPAINFYKKSGAHILADWKLVQMDESGLNAFVAKLE